MNRGSPSFTFFTSLVGSEGPLGLRRTELSSVKPVARYEAARTVIYTPSGRTYNITGPTVDIPAC